MKNILQKIKKAELTGRGGGAFPTALKWQMVKRAKVHPKGMINANGREGALGYKGDKKYIICNVSEGEPGVLKDKYILENYAEEAIDGIKIAIDYLGAKRAYFYLNQKYYYKYHHKLRKIIKDASITIFKKDHEAGYIGGEETSAINHIEGAKVEPRLRPPFPTTNGLWGYPTLINNLETFYNVSQIANDRYKNKRLFTINGDCLNRGVFELDENLSIYKVLKQTGNYPDFDFFVQVGGDASGEVLASSQLKRKAIGSASITIYSQFKHDPIKLIRKWAKFFRDESCGQCAPCREGTQRLVEVLKSPKVDWEMCGDVLENLSQTSFCGLGLAAPVAIKSYAKNVLAKIPDDKQIFPGASNKFVCKCLK